MSSSKLSLEDLSNDVFMEIFDYLYGQHIVFAFSQLNSRFNSLCIRYPNYHIDATDNHTFVNNRKFNHLLRLVYSKHIRSLKFREERWIQRISPKYLVSLCSLTFSDANNATIIKEFIEKLPSPHHLYHLSINFRLCCADIQDIVTAIFKLPNLTRLEWNSYVPNIDFDIISQPLLSLRHLSITCREWNDFLKLVPSIPNLISLNLSNHLKYMYIDSMLKNRANTLSKLKSFEMNSVCAYNDIIFIFEVCPQLKIFKVKCETLYHPDSIFKAKHWEQLLSPMKFLQKINIIVVNNSSKNVIDLSEYQTDFWVERNLKAIVYDDPKLNSVGFSIKSD